MRARRGRIWALTAAAALAIGVITASGGAAAAPAPRATTPQVLLVGTFHGVAGQYTSIQAAVAAAAPGDWILIAPGDYHEDWDLTHPSVSYGEGAFAGVYITKSDLHLRGMSRSGVVVDGTKPGAPECSSAPSEQEYGWVKGGKAEGRNGIVVWKANNVSIDNLTVCNFLAGAGASGNEIWWNGGAESGKIGKLKGYEGSYLTATSTFFSNESTAAQYGIFSSNAEGPGSWNWVYANNFNDSGMYVGACQQACDMTIDHAWMENNALGYSGTNSGGMFVIENSQFDHNEDGLDTNTQIDGDPPAPQNGDCPGTAKSPITHTRSCWVFIHNYSHNNNNPNTPRAGSAAAGPTGTGMTISGGRNDTVMDNRFSDNGAWGILFVPYPGGTYYQYGQSCSGTGGVVISGFGCVYDPMSDALLGNTFHHNGYFGNPDNSDFGQITIAGNQPRNCYAHNVDPDGSAPSNLEATQPTCGPLTKGPNTGGALFDQVLCDTGYGACPAGAHYPQPSKVELTKAPTTVRSMANPCAGVPDNAWCTGGKPIT